MFWFTYINYALEPTVLDVRGYAIDKSFGIDPGHRGVELMPVRANPAD